MGNSTKEYNEISARLVRSVSIFRGTIVKAEFVLSLCVSGYGRKEQHMADP